MIYLGIDGSSFYISKDSKYQVRGSTHQGSAYGYKVKEPYDESIAIRGSIIMFRDVECYVREERSDMFELVLVNNDSTKYLAIDEDSFDQ